MAIEQRARIREGMVEVRLTYVGGNGEIWGLPSYMFYIGDVNPFEHGGTLYIEEEDGSLRFLRFEERQEEGIVVTSDGMIYIEDYMDNMVEVLRCVDLDIDLTDKEEVYGYRYEIADALLYYYGYENFGGFREERTDEEAVEMLKSFYGWDIEIV